MIPLVSRQIPPLTSMTAPGELELIACCSLAASEVLSVQVATEVHAATAAAIVRAPRARRALMCNPVRRQSRETAYPQQDRRSDSRGSPESVDTSVGLILPLVPLLIAAM